MHAVNGLGPAFPLIRIGQDLSELLFEIKPGQILTGRIVGPTAEGYVASFRGKPVLLQTTGSFEPGQEIQAELVQQDGALHLRLIRASAQTGSRLADTSASVDQRAATILAQLDLESTRENMFAAQGLLLAKLPVSRSLVETLAFLLSGKTSLGSELVHLSQLLREIMPQIADAGVADQFEQLLALLESTLAAPDDESNLAARLRAFLANSGLFAENKLRRLLKSGTPSAALEQIDSDLKLLLLRLRSVLASRSQQLRQFLGAGTLKALEQRIGDALRLVRGQQVQNLINTSFNQLLFFIPFLSEWGLDDVYVRFFYDRKTLQKKGARPVAIRIELNTTNLGRVRALLQFHRGKAHCHFTAERESVAELIRAESHSLSERLKTLNIEVGHITCGVGKSEENVSPTAPWDVSFWRTIDVKV